MYIYIHIPVFTVVLANFIYIYCQFQIVQINFVQTIQSNMVITRMFICFQRTVFYLETSQSPSGWFSRW